TMDSASADFAASWAFRWQKTGETGRIAPVVHPHLFDLDDLVGVDHAKEELVRNTAQFVAGASANNVLLWGERGNGKSSCVKGLLRLFAPRGLRLIELQRWDLLSLSAIVGQLRHQPFRFILFCDDLSFAEGEGEYRALKTLLDGGIEERPGNVLIYATSNRRHLMPEPMNDNIGGGEIHPEEAVSEKLSLSDRFGLAIGFSTFDQETYLAIVRSYGERLNVPIGWEELRKEAILWALYSGRRSGRAARQFIDDLKGRLELA
ncbi:MAG TPA: ATP-binding protein, partial [Geobacteraceae bacterium]|nr:ATP-binding protein [Geobacteraceae bacterium]